MDGQQNIKTKHLFNPRVCVCVCITYTPLPRHFSNLSVVMFKIQVSTFNTGSVLTLVLQYKILHQPTSRGTLSNTR